MELGIFAETFIRPSAEQNVQAIAEHGFRTVQYNFSCAGLETLPEHIEMGRTETIGQELDAQGITVAALSGTFNLIHPDQEKRREGLHRLWELAFHAPILMKKPIITLCTGTRNSEDMWRSHPDNVLPDAWHTVLTSMGRVLEMAEDSGVTVAIEPESANVVSSAYIARCLLDEMQSSHLKIILDPANLFHTPEDLQQMQPIISEAFDLLADHIVLAHAKDVIFDGVSLRHCPAGTGHLDYGFYLEYLRLLQVPLIMHGLSEAEVPGVQAFLQAQLRGHENHQALSIGREGI